jgi:uncharacterized membrane protein YphA (DoxX/SURF4 family)
MQQIQKLLNNKYLVVACRVIVGGIFVLAGITKLLEPIEEFIAIGRSWDIVPDPLLTWYMTLLPWVEVVFGILLLVGLFTRISAAVIALTILSFIIGITVNMMRGRTLEECGCFGGALDFGDSFQQLLWRDLVLMGMTLVLMCTKQTWLSLDKYFQKS